MLRKQEKARRKIDTARALTFSQYADAKAHGVNAKDVFVLTKA